MYISVRPFRYRGVTYNPGDTVPAEKWTNKRALVTTKRIRHVEGEEAVEVAKSSPPVLSKMKRSELNDYAASIGIENPGDASLYSNREALIAKIESVLNPSSPPADSGGFIATVTVSGETIDGVEESTDEVEDDEDPFADLDSTDEVEDTNS